MENNQMEQNSTEMTKLPVEIIVHILNFLEEVTYLRQSRVCKYFGELILTTKKTFTVTFHSPPIMYKLKYAKFSVVVRSDSPKKLLNFVSKSARRIIEYEDHREEKDCPEISSMTNIKKLFLFTPHDHTKHVGKLTSLENLTYLGCQIEPLSLAKLVNITNLEWSPSDNTKSQQFHKLQKLIIHRGVLVISSGLKYGGNISVTVNGNIVTDANMCMFSSAGEIFVNKSINLIGVSLEGFKNLISLSLIQCTVFNSTYLKTLKLKKLILIDTKAENCDIEHMTLLEELTLSGTNITKSPSIALKILVLKVNDFCGDSVKTLTNLTELSLGSGNKISDKDLVPLTKLRYLDAKSNGIMNGFGIKNSTNLRSLNISKSGVRGEYLKLLTKLENLNLSSNDFVENCHITQLKLLENLDLESNKKITENVFEHLPSINYVKINENSSIRRGFPNTHYS